MTASVADRIRTLIEAARTASSAAGREFNAHEVYVKALVRCGIGREEAAQLLADKALDPVSRILHFAGESHNFAVLAVEEALNAA